MVQIHEHVLNIKYTALKFVNSKCFGENKFEIISFPFPIVLPVKIINIDFIIINTCIHNY